MSNAQDAMDWSLDQWTDKVMEQAQVFASAWSLVGGQFDSGQMLQDAERAKAELKELLKGCPNYREGLAGKLIDVWVASKGQLIPWDKAVEICGIVTRLPAAEMQRLRSLDEEKTAMVSPLTQEYIDAHIGPDEDDREAVTAVVREVERAYGIGVKS